MRSLSNSWGGRTKITWHLTFTMRVYVTRAAAQETTSIVPAIGWTWQKYGKVPGVLKVTAIELVPGAIILVSQLNASPALDVAVWVVSSLLTHVTGVPAFIITGLPFPNCEFLIIIWQGFPQLGWAEAGGADGPATEAPEFVYRYTIGLVASKSMATPTINQRYLSLKVTVTVPALLEPSPDKKFLRGLLFGKIYAFSFFESSEVACSSRIILLKNTMHKYFPKDGLG